MIIMFKKLKQKIEDLERENQILFEVNLELHQRITELEQINEQHRQTNGELREILNKLNGKN